MKELDQSVFDGVPPEYKWFAIDANGDKYYYVDEPVLESYAWDQWLSRCHFAGRLNLNSIEWREVDWKETLIKREQ